MNQKVCASCHGLMTGYATVSLDQKVIRTTWLCPRCLYREHDAKPNPRFSPLNTAPKPPWFSGQGVI